MHKEHISPEDMVHGSRHFQPGEGPSRGLLRDCTTSPITRFAALVFNKIMVPVLSPDLLHALQVGAEAAVAAEDLLVHDGGDGQTVETVREGLPQLNVVSPLTYEHNHHLRLPMAVCLVKFNCKDANCK